jgi:hypothetical protein
LRHRGVEPANIFVWPENGIEFMYPSDVLGEIFAVGKQFDYAKMKLKERAYVTYGEDAILETKESLAQKVCERVEASSDFPPSPFER